MRLLNDAIRDSLALSPNRRSSLVSLTEAYGRYLSAPIYAAHSLPLWDQSAMDGYAVRASDATEGSELTLGEIIPAGHWPQRELKFGEAARIFTGAPLPTGADAVLIQENATSLNERSIRVNQCSIKGEHIRQAGEELKAGANIAQIGDLVTPGLLGLLAAQGLTQVEVFTKPTVAILETGSELVTQGECLRDAQIYATNALTLTPMVTNSGAHLLSTARANDSVEEVVSLIHDQISAGAQIIITTGGVSVGDFDPIHEALEQLGATRSFWKVKMKPGKPVSVAKLALGEDHSCLLIGLPGNPVSCVVAYLLFVHPLLQHLSGVSRDALGLPRQTCHLSHDIKKRHHRAELFRVVIENQNQEIPSCRLTGGQSSGWISSIALGDGLLYTPAEPCQLLAGERVEVALFPWSTSLPRRVLFS